MKRLLTRRSAAEWHDLVAAQPLSGLSAPKFCQQQGISYQSFAKWRQRLSVEPDPQVHQRAESMPSFIDLSGLAMSGRWSITLSLGNGVELRLNQD